MSFGLASRREVAGAEAGRPTGGDHRGHAVHLGRIGEVLAIRKCDVDVTRSPARVRICATVVSPTCKPTFRQDHPKTSSSRRTISVPTFTAEVLRHRLVSVAAEDAEHPRLLSRNHTPLTTSDVSRPPHQRQSF